MSEDTTPTYSGDVSGLRQAAADLRRDGQGDNPAPAESLDVSSDPVVKAGDEKGEGVTLREMTGAYSRAREQQQQEADELNRALGLTEAEEAPPVVEPIAKPEAQAQPQEQKQDPVSEWHRAQALAQLAQMEQIQQAVISTLQQEFPEIQTEDDLHALASLDYERYMRAVSLVNQSRQLANNHQQINIHVARENAQRFNNWAVNQDVAFRGKHPELKDDKAFDAIRNGAVQMLASEGFTQDELTALWEGKGSITLRDARLQTVITDAARYRMAKAAGNELRAKPLPPAQRPGTRAQYDGAVPSGIQNLRSRVDKNPSVRNMAALLSAERRAAQRG